MTANEHDLRSLADKHGQGHLFQHWPMLNDRQRNELLTDLSRIDFALVAELARGKGVYAAATLDTTSITAPEVFPEAPTADQVEFYRRARQLGQDLLRQHRVAVMVVAGGQGTRLGFDGPKGAFGISPLKNKTLFQLFAESVRAVQTRYSCRLPWYIMTSSATDESTREFFEAKGYFGLERREVRFFQQGVMPAVDDAGRILLEEPNRVALSPNGHGGSLLALQESGVLAEMLARGIEVISYFQVDNPLVSVVHPLFIGLHRLSAAQFSSIAVPKADDLEKVGNFVRTGGHLQVIEYSDLPESLARARNPDGSRRLDAGNIAIHLLDTRFVAELTGPGSAARLPWHRACKKVPYWDGSRRAVAQPEAPNATKFEMFVFDAIPLARKSILLRLPREECFSPVKNAEGVDSAVTARRDMMRRAARWLEQAGVTVPRDAAGEPAARLEISPLRALDAEQLRETIRAPLHIAPGQNVYLE